MRNKIERILSSATKSSSDYSTDPTSLLSLLQSGNVEIYWPYSDNWDGVSYPVITYLQTLDENDCAVAYKIISDDTIEKILVSEEYAKEHPVWVISEPEIEYEDVPDFNKGETKAGDVTYLALKPKTKSSESDEVSSEDNYYWGLSGIICRKQYDSWLSGASDFKFIVAYPQIGTNGNVSGATTEFSVKIKRKYIDKDNPKEYILYNRALNQNWDVTQKTNYLCVYEDDTITNKTTNVSVTVKSAIPDSLKKYVSEVNTTITFSIGANDKVVGKEVMYRSYVFSNTYKGNLYGLDYGKSGSPNLELRFITKQYN